MCCEQNLNCLVLLISINLCNISYLVKVNIMTYYYLNESLLTDFPMKN